MSKEIKYTKHTPTPWEAVKGDVNIPRESDTAWGSIISANGFHIAKIEIDGDHPEEDAKLLAAAPELLAVAERIVAGGMAFPKYERELAKAAIAKAKGEI